MHINKNKIKAILNLIKIKTFIAKHVLSISGVFTVCMITLLILLSFSNINAFQALHPKKMMRLVKTQLIADGNLILNSQPLLIRADMAVGLPTVFCKMKNTLNGIQSLSCLKLSDYGSAHQSIVMLFNHDLNSDCRSLSCYYLYDKDEDVCRIFFRSYFPGPYTQESFAEFLKVHHEDWCIATTVIKNYQKIFK